MVEVLVGEYEREREEVSGRIQIILNPAKFQL